MKREALVVGINRYPFLNSGKPAHLEKPRKDAQEVARLLNDYGDFEVQVLPSLEGTQNIDSKGKGWVKVEELREAILRLFQPTSSTPPDTVVLYFAGHGLSRPGDKETEGFLATSDADTEHDCWGISLKWLRQVLQESQVKQQIVWLDCCYSGELFNFAQTDLGEARGGRDRCFIAACREFQVAYGQESGEHGVLTGTLLQGLDPTKQADGWATNRTLKAFIEEALKDEPQHPVLSNSGGEIILTGKNGVKGNICPYKGLNFFDFNEEDAKDFYGRTKLTNELLDKVRQSNFVAVLGASGSGKSSVVRAGLLYQLTLGEVIQKSEGWKIYPPFTPGEHPLASLEKAIGVKPDELEAFINDAPKRVVLAIDQFEEVFTLCHSPNEDLRQQYEDERQRFFECLMNAVEHVGNKLCLVLAMRGDFFGKCLEQEYGGLADKIKKNLLTVMPMSQQELKEAITKPAERVGLEITPELVNRMIADIKGSPGDLPLLQYALTQLWNHRPSKRLTISDYDSLGGLHEALEKRANEVYQQLSDDHKSIAKRVFLELTQLGEGTEDTRRQVSFPQLVNSQQTQEQVERVVRQLANANLVVTSDPELAGEAMVNITHEALIRNWSRLRNWLKDNRDAIRIERRIEEDAKEWTAKGKPEGLLLREGRLVEAEDYQRNYPNLGFLDGVAQEFIDKSIELRNSTRKKEQQQALFLVYMVFEAVTKATIAELGEQAALARLKNPVDGLITAIKLTGESQNKLKRVLDSVQTTLFDLLKKPVESNILIDHKKNVTSVAFSPDGSYIASGSEDRTVRLWDLKGNPITILKGHEDYINSIAFSPDSRYIVTASSDKTVRLWDLKGNPTTILKGHENVVSSVAFSPDGKYIVSGGYDGMRLWDREGNLNQPLVIYSERVFSVAFSPDGQTIASANWAAVRLWDLKGNPIGKPIKVHKYAVYSVAFSSNGQYIVTSGTDGIVKVVNLKEEKDIRTIEPESDSHVNSVALNPYSDSKYTYLAIASGKTVRIKNLDGSFIGQALEHEDKVTSVAFSPDGQYIVTGNWDKTVRLWELRNLIEPLPSPEDHKALLQVACRRLFSHSTLVEAKTEEARAACETCQKYVWDETETAQFLLNQGRAIARQGNFEEAVAKFKQAQEFAPILDLDPEAEARSLAAFAQSETEKNLTVNQILLPDLPNYATYGQVKLSDFTLNNQGNVVRVAHGEKISAFTQYIYDCPGCQRGSINQIIVGIAGQNQAQACIYNGSIQGSGSSQFTLTAPDEPGIYYIRFRYAQAYGCDTALGWWRVDGEPTSEANIGAIVVVEQG